MASGISRPWRSVGKIVRSRRTAVPNTPYDRPQSPPNPNWLSRLIYSPTRVIATGAGKLLSSVFTNYDSSSSSSSSDSDSEEDIDDDNENDATDVIEKNGTSEISNHIRSGPQPIVEKIFETKSLIEQLVMQVTFSREECNRLTSIIKSRVADGPIIDDTEDRRLTELCNRTIGSDVNMPDHCSAAVKEAKRWLEQKKSGSSPKSELELGTCTLNSVMSPHVTEAELGSPVDMAKLYMLMRPPWASPSTNHIGYRSPSSTGIQLCKEETPYSTGYTSFVPSKVFHFPFCKMKRDSPASCSWDILEETRKVRSNATEEMLRTPLSLKIDWTSFALKNKSVINSLVAEEAETSRIDKVHSSTKPVATSVNVASGVSTSYGFSVTQLTRDMLPNEAVPRNPETVYAQNQALEGIPTVKETTDSRLNKRNCSTSKEMAGKSGSLAVNGFPTSGTSLAPGQDREQNENLNPVASSHDEVPPSVEVYELIGEASGDVPVVYENDSIATGSQNSSSMQNEGLSQDPTTPNSKLSKNTAAAEKQQGKKLSRYYRRRRGRGRDK